MKKALALSLAGALLASSAFGQAINTVPQPGMISQILKNPTYSATSVGLVPAASATDFWCISGGTSKNIAIRKIVVGGTAGTAITTPVLVYQRSALGTAGTAATGLALPVATPNFPADPGGASTATVTAYTANPTVASNPILMDAMLVDLPVTTAAGGNVETIRTYGTATDMFSRGLDIPKNTTIQYCLNLNGVSVSSGVLVVHVEWQEAN